MTAPPASAVPIAISGLSKIYRLGFFLDRKVMALRGLDLEVQAGSVYGLLGPNGAGKSTTIKILMNLVKPTSGQARLFGLTPHHPDARNQVGFVPENPSPYEYLTGREFVTLAGRLCGLRGHELDGRVKTVLGEVGMERAADLQIRRYSKGMIQRVALAQALVHRPKLLILDEPTSGLDPVGRRQMRDLILAERARGTTILFCTHIIPDVEALCDRAAVLVGGTLAREGSVKALVTSQTPQVELTVEGLTEEALRALGHPVDSIVTLGDRLLVKAPDAQAQALLKAALDAGARVLGLQPSRFSLEDLFLQALEQAKGSTVGSEISS
jgi:ABC-2 type transport system ATP-binding protein